MTFCYHFRENSSVEPGAEQKKEDKTSPKPASPAAQSGNVSQLDLYWAPVLVFAPIPNADTTQHVISAIFRKRNTNNRQQNGVIRD